MTLKQKLFIGVGVLAVIAVGYMYVFDQKIARTFGGTVNIVLPEGENPIDIEWKDSETIWVTSKMPNGCLISRENAEVFGIVTGSVKVCPKNAN